VTVPAGWDGLLDPGEEILWQGAPDPGFHFRARNLALTAFGAAFAAFALFWMVMASRAGGGFWMFGLIHFSVGVSLILGSLFWGTFKRRRTFYSLSDRRAFIATNLPIVGRRLKSYPITPQTVLTLEERDLPSIFFAREVRRSKNGTQNVPVGFVRIPDAVEVYSLMRRIQAGMAKEVDPISEKP